MTGATTTHGDKQREALMLFMRAFRDTQHYLPTIADISSGLGMARTAVVWHLEMLRDEGRVDYVDGHMSHSLRLR
jgi:biotin operon repressor